MGILTSTILLASRSTLRPFHFIGATRDFASFPIQWDKLLRLGINYIIKCHGVGLTSNYRQIIMNELIAGHHESKFR